MDYQKLPPFPPEVLARFRRGEDRERDLLIDLARIGRLMDPPFNVIGEQERFFLHDRKGRVVISGKVDARISIGTERPIPIECKAWNQHLVDRTNTFDDLFISPWTRKGAYQLLCYMYGSESEFGLMLLDRNGIPKPIPVNLTGENYQRVEEFLQLAEIAVDHMEAGVYPPYIKDAAECRRCPFFGCVCNPPVDSGPGATILSDQALIEKLDRRQELASASKEFEILDKDVKESLRGIEMGLAGNHLLEGKWQSSTTYDVPKEIKEKYKKTNEKGKFVLKITPISQAGGDPE
jgi:hypothetical protein